MSSQVIAVGRIAIDGPFLGPVVVWRGCLATLGGHGKIKAPPGRDWYKCTMSRLMTAGAMMKTRIVERRSTWFVK